MARWRRLKRIGASLARRVWRTEISTKGEKLVRDVRLLKCPYYMLTTETQGGESVMVLVVGESATIPVAAPENANWERDCYYKNNLIPFTPAYYEWMNEHGGDPEWITVRWHETHTETWPATVVWQKGEDGYSRRDSVEDGVVDFTATVKCEVQVTDSSTAKVRGDGSVREPAKTETSVREETIRLGTRARVNFATGELLGVEQVPGCDGMIPVSYEASTTEVVNVERIDAIDDPDIPAGVDFKPGI